MPRRHRAPAPSQIWERPASDRQWWRVRRHLSVCCLFIACRSATRARATRRRLPISIIQGSTHHHLSVDASPASVPAPCPPPLPVVGSHNLQRGRREEKKVMKFGCSKFKFILKLNWMLKIGMPDNLNVNWKFECSYKWQIEWEF
jgi:hypothetical protein